MLKQAGDTLGKFKPLKLRRPHKFASEEVVRFEQVKIIIKSSGEKQEE